MKRDWNALLIVAMTVPSFAQSAGGAQIKGRITDETGAALPGVTVELLGGRESAEAVTTTTGDYSFDGVAPGTYQLSMRLINFATINHRDLTVQAGQV